MTQPTPHPQSQPAPQPISPLPAFNTLAQFIQAASSGGRDPLLHLFMTVFNIAKAAIALIARHYQEHPRAITPAILARITYCASRLKAILYTLQHAPDRFLSPSQLRALTRARAVLAHILHQPVDFTPLAPLLSPLANRPPRPPRASSPESLATPRSALRASSADPLLLRAPGSALAGVMLQLAAIYRVPASPALTPQPETSVSTPSGAPAVEPPSTASDPLSTPHGPQESGSTEPGTADLTPPASSHAPP